MKIGLGQINPRIGDFAGQKKRIQEWIKKAKAEKADLVVFPELTLTGYPVRDLVDSPAFIEKNLALLQELAPLCRDIAVVVGFISKNGSPFGKPFQNSAAFLSEGKVALIYHKQLLPYYDVFEEERYFEPGTKNAIFQFKGKSIALTICEDLWNGDPSLPRPYEKDPLRELLGQSLDVVVNLSASPFHVGKSEQRCRLFSGIAKALNANVLFCNQVGANDELIFDGCSFAINRRGEMVSAASAFQEDLIFFSETETKVKPSWPTAAPAWQEEALVLGIRDYFNKCGATKAILGLSGGIDSSVTAVLATKALGPQSVAALSMPTQYTSQASQEDAAILASHLGISLCTVDMEPLLASSLKVLKPLFPSAMAGLTVENIQPRLRMACVMAVANEEKSLLLNTSNKSEVATGYATLYGDTAGALSVLGDLTKEEVRSLAHHFNRQGEVIPRRVIERSPSAELRENQTDEQSLPPYSVLDPLVRESIERHRPLADLKDAEEKRWSDLFAKLHGSSEYKRRQFAPILRVSPKAFGMGRRIPIAAVRSDL